MVLLLPLDEMLACGVGRGAVVEAGEMRGDGAGGGGVRAEGERRSLSFLFLRLAS